MTDATTVGSNSGTELGSVASDWKPLRFNTVVNEIISGDWGQAKASEGLVRCRVLRGTDFPDVEQNVVSEVPIRFLKSKSLSNRKLYAGDLLVEISGGSKAQPTGRMLLITEELLEGVGMPVTFSNFVKRLRLSETVYPEYFRLYWQKLYQQGQTRSYEKRTTGIYNFKLDEFLKSEDILVPALPEQKKIAAVLSTVQEAKEKTEVVIEATKELKRSLMKHLFTYGPVSPKEAENVPLKETKIGLVPEGWEVHALGEIAEVRYGIQASVSRNIDSAMGIPILTNVNITLDGQISLAQLKYYDLEKKKNGDEYILRRGDVVFNWRSGSKKHLGKTAYFDLNREMTHSSFILRIRSLNNEYVNNKYLYHYLLFIRSLAKYFEQYYDFVVNAKFNASHTRQIPVYVPPLEVQTEIADILSSVASRIEVEENKKKALEELFRTLLNNLMTGKVRVDQLEVQA